MLSGYKAGQTVLIGHQAGPSGLVTLAQVEAVTLRLYSQILLIREVG